MNLVESPGAPVATGRSAAGGAAGTSGYRPRRTRRPASPEHAADLVPKGEQVHVSGWVGAEVQEDEVGDQAAAVSRQDRALRDSRALDGTRGAPGCTGSVGRPAEATTSMSPAAPAQEGP